MHRGAGIALIAVGSSVGLLSALGLWRRLPAAAGLGLAAACGVAVGAGALLVQQGAGPGDWAITLPALAVLVPVNLRAVLGPVGRHARS